VVKVFAWRVRSVKEGGVALQTRGPLPRWNRELLVKIINSTENDFRLCSSCNDRGWTRETGDTCMLCWSRIV